MRTDRPFPQGGIPKQELQGRKIILGVCGGIAAYKAVELTRLLIKNGARVQVVMTRSATKFVAPLTFEAITARNVYVEMFPEPGEISPWHTELASWPDVAVVAPATANHMAHLAAGLADDLLSTLMLTLERPKILAPAMNPRMWANPATQDNLATLKRRGYHVVMPETGQMARPGEDDGVGRLANPESIYREVHHILSAPQDLRGVRVLVTAGRTEEFWDPVRVLTNRATGRMGFALAEEARERGADVVLVHGPTDAIPPTGVRIRRITSAAEMANVVKQEVQQAKIVLMSAAVADYTFSETVQHKIKKGSPSQEINLVPTEDILKSISQQKGDRVVVGFALETENLLENALKKLREKHLDIVVANNPLIPGSGFAGETNQVLIIHRNGRVADLPLQSKREIAREILNEVIQIYRNPEPEPEPDTELDEEDLRASPTSLYYDDVEEDAATEVPVKPAARPTNTPPPRPQKFQHQKPIQKPTPPILPAVKSPPPSVESATPTLEIFETEKAEPETTIAGQPQGKRGRTRRGGRRSAKARAARLAASGGANQTSQFETNSAPQVRESVPPAIIPAPPAVLTPAPEASSTNKSKKPPRSRRPHDKAKPKVETNTAPETVAVESKQTAEPLQSKPAKPRYKKPRKKPAGPAQQ